MVSSKKKEKKRGKNNLFEDIYLLGEKIKLHSAFMAFLQARLCLTYFWHTFKDKKVREPPSLQNLPYFCASSFQEHFHNDNPSVYTTMINSETPTRNFGNEWV